MIEVNEFQPYKRLPYQRIVHRRDHIPAIAAAAMLAKTTRDKRIEVLLATQYPDYGLSPLSPLKNARLWGHIKVKELYMRC